MWCRWVQRDLTALVDGELAAKRAERVRRHVGHCETCTDLLAGLEQTVRRQREVLPLLNDAVETPVDDMLRRVRRGMREQAEERHRWWLTPQVVAAVAASAVAVLGLLRFSEPLLVAAGLEDPPEIVVEKPDLFRDYTLFEHLDTIEHLEVGSTSPADSRS
jgi:anti-sigma factor RsiW